MFYKLELTKSLDLPPKFFGAKLRETIEAKLRDEVEGTCDQSRGYIIAVNTLSDVSRGVIRKDGTGFATFLVRYQCIVFRPFKGEVLDCAVRDVSNQGFITTAGPMQIFVSHHLIPDDFELEAGDEMMYVSRDGEDQIKVGSQVRVQVIGFRVQDNNFAALGSISRDYLGPIMKA